MTPTLVVVLAGGSNSRFQPLRDKTLLPIFGRPLLLHHLDALAGAGFHDVVVVANDRTAGHVRALLEGYRRPGALVEVVVQERAEGMGDAVLAAANAFGDAALRPVLITQAHDVVEPELFRRLAEAIAAGGEELGGLITGRRMAEYFPGGYLETGDGGRLRGIVEKPGAGNEPSDLINIVIHWHRDAAALFEAIRAEYAKPASADDHYERALDALFARGYYQVFPYDGAWQPIKYPWHVLDVMDFYLARSGDEVVAEGVRVFDGAKIVGPSYIGPGSIVGNGSLVRASMIGENTEVGYGCEVARSWVGSNVHLHHAYVGDSVVDDHAGLAFGTVTANWPFYPPPVRSSAAGERLRTEREKFGAIVGARVRTGIGVLLYPGVKVGYGAYIGPGVVVTGDVEARKLVVVKQELDVRDNPFVGPDEAIGSGQ
jgi:bifunctional UDP-N-acetylglucosamine pyrophosphorylase/glucosamine-1-phosphate N-acetyltransferase